MMNAWAILGRMLPAWRHVVGQMQHDLYHIYTVDQHSLLVVKTSAACAVASTRMNIPSVPSS